MAKCLRTASITNSYNCYYKYSVNKKRAPVPFTLSCLEEACITRIKCENYYKNLINSFVRNARGSLTLWLNVCDVYIHEDVVRVHNCCSIGNSCVLCLGLVSNYFGNLDDSK